MFVGFFSRATSGPGIGWMFSWSSWESSPPGSWALSALRRIKNQPARKKNLGNWKAAPFSHLSRWQQMLSTPTSTTCQPFCLFGYKPGGVSSKAHSLADHAFDPPGARRAAPARVQGDVGADERPHRKR